MKERMILYELSTILLIFAMDSTFASSGTNHYELIKTDTWCQPLDGITSYMDSTVQITASECLQFCEQDDLAMSFMIREETVDNIHQCLCHGGPCLEMSHLNAEHYDAYKMIDRVNKVCIDDEVYLYGKNGSSDSQCVLESVLQACFDAKCGTENCCSDLVSCSTRKSCKFKAHSSSNCVQECQDLYIDQCDCPQGVSCMFVENVGQFGCLVDCIKPDNATLWNNYQVAGLVNCNEGESTIKRGTSCEIQCRDLHVPSSSGLIECDLLAQTKVDTCLAPCQVVVRNQRRSKDSPVLIVILFDSCIFVPYTSLYFSLSLALNH